MHPLSPKALERILTSNGFEISRQKGSHVIYKQVNSGVIVPVPLHGKNKPLPLGTFMAIVKQSRLPKDVFLK